VNGLDLTVRVTISGLQSPLFCGTTIALLTALVNGRRRDRRAHRETSANVEIVIEYRRMVDENRQKRDRLWEAVANQPELPEI
jgi:hypothetical protein